MSRRLRIAFVVHDYSRALGQGRYVAELASRFRRDHEVHVFANTFDEPDPAGIASHHVPAWRRNALTTILSFLLPATLAVRGRFDVVHAQGLCGLRQNVVTAHICTAAWFAAVDRFAGRQPWRKRVFRALVGRLERLAFRPHSARRFIAVSGRVREDLARHYRLTERVRVIPHGVDADRFHPANRGRWRAAVRKELGLADGEFVALYVGDWQKAGPPLAGMLARAAGVRLVVLTRTPPDAVLRDAAGVADRLVLVPPTGEVERYYAAADVLAFPSFYDTFGLVVAEAMASGLPVVTSRAVGAAELIAPGQNGLLTEHPWDAGQLAAAVAQLRDDAGLRGRLGAAARAAVEPHTWDRVAERTMAVYREVTGPRRRPPLPRIAFVVNGGPGSAMGERAASLAGRLGDEFDVRLIHRGGGKGTAAARMLRGLARFGPAACYVFDLAADGVAAAGAYKHLTGAPFAVDTGDAVVELGRALGRGPAALLATRALEAYALRAARRVVVRGSFHKELLARRGVHAVVIPDGVDVDQFAPDLEPKPDPARPLVIGLVGSSVWVPARRTCYGWELVELVRRLRGRLPRPVRGVLIGDGSGIEVLKRRCAEYGIADLVEFAGRVPYAELPRRLRGFDVCLSTQTDDVIGNVRTTGKLPLYLAAGRFVLASRVGEAARVLPPEMLVDFAGESDPAYPEKLAARLTELVAAGEAFSPRPECVAIARAHFEYDRLAARLRGVLRGLLG